MSDNIDLTDGFRGGRTNPDEETDLSFDQGEFSSDIGGSKRTPIENAMKAAKEGAWETVDLDFTKAADKLVKITMPSDLRTKIDSSKEIWEEKDDEFDESTTTARNQVSDILETVAGMMPSGSLKDRLSKWGDQVAVRPDSSSGPRLDPESLEYLSQQAENEAKYELDDLFEAHNAQQERRDLENQTFAAKQHLENSKRDDITKGLLKQIRDSQETATRYTTEVTAKYQRKSLELRFKQVFLATELLSKSQGFFETNSLQMEALVKNTSLPEFNKLEALELVEQHGYAHLANTAMDAMGDEESYLGRRVASIRDYSLDRLNLFNENLSQAKLGLDTYNMAAEDGIFGIIKEGSSALTEKIISFIPDVIRSQLGNDHKVTKSVDGFYNHVANAPYRAEEIIDNLTDKLSERGYEEVEGDGTLLGGAKATATNAFRSAKTKGPAAAMREVQRALHFSNGDFSIGINRTEEDGGGSGGIGGIKSVVTLNQVIPEYLSRILGQVTSIRTGEPVGRMVFDHATGTMKDSDEFTREIREGHQNAESLTQYRENVNEFISDVFGDYVGSDDTKRQDLAKRIYTMGASKVSNNKEFNTHLDLIKAGLVSKEDDPELYQFLIDSYNAEIDRIDTHGNKFTKFEDLSNTVPHMQRYIKSLRDVHGADGLIRSGLVNINGKDALIDSDAILSLFAGEGGSPSIGEPDSSASPQPNNGGNGGNGGNGIGGANSLDKVRGLWRISGDTFSEVDDKYDLLHTNSTSTQESIRILGSQISGAISKLRNSIYSVYGYTATDIIESDDDSNKVKVSLTERLGRVFNGLNITGDGVFEKPALKEEPEVDMPGALSGLPKVIRNLFLANKVIKHREDIMRLFGVSTLNEGRAIKEAAQERWDNSKLKDKTDEFGDSVKTNYSQFKDGASKLYEEFRDDPKVAVENSGVYIASGISELNKTIKRSFGYSEEDEIEVNPSAKERLKTVSEKIADAFGNSADKVKYAFNDKNKDGVRDGSWKEKDGVVTADRSAEASAMPATKTSGLMDKLRDIIGMLPGGAAILGLLGTGASIVGGAASMAGGMTKWAVGGIVERFGMGKLFKSLANTAATSLIGKGGLIGTAIGGALLLAANIDTITNFFKDDSNDLVESTSDFVDSTIVSIHDKITDFKNFVKDSHAEVVEDAVGSIEYLVKATSGGPKKVPDFHDDFDDDIESAMGKEVSKADSVSAEISGNLLDTVTKALSFSAATSTYSMITGALRKNITDVDLYRMVQYGIPKPEDNLSLVRRIMRMERIMMVNFAMVKEVSGWKFRPSEMLMRGLWDVTGLGQSNRQYASAYAEWLAKRMVPVMIAHLNAASALEVSIKLGTGETIPAGQLESYVEAVEEGVSPDVYSVAYNPYVRRGVDSLVTDVNLINTYGKAVVAKNATKRKEVSKSILNGFVEDAHASSPTQDMIDDYMKKQKPPEVTTSPSGPHKAVGRNFKKALPPLKTTKKQVVEDIEGHDYGALDLGVSISELTGLNPAVYQNLMNMASDYHALTGKKLRINSAKRSSAKQALLKSRYPDKAAKSKSMHEYGFAVDIPQKQVDKLVELGLLNEHGFNRPLSSGRERHHIEPTVLQGHLDLFKGNPNLMDALFDKGKGVTAVGLGQSKEATKQIRRSNKPFVNLTKADMRKSAIGGGRTEDRAVLNQLDKAAARYDLDPDLLRVMAAKESSLNPNAVNPITGATGLGQATKRMWQDWTDTPDSKLYANDRKDPEANAMASAWYIKNNMDGMRKYMPEGSKNPVYSYLITLLGPTGGRRFAKAIKEKPDDLCINTVGKKVVKSNSAYFTKGGRVLTNIEAFRNIEASMRETSAGFNLTFPGDKPKRSANVVPKLSDGLPSVPNRTVGRNQTPPPLVTTVSEVKLERGAMSTVESKLESGNASATEMVALLKQLIKLQESSQKESSQSTQNTAKERPDAQAFNVSNE